MLRSKYKNAEYPRALVTEGFGLAAGKWLILLFYEWDNETQGSYDEYFETKDEALAKAHDLGYIHEIPKETN